VRSNPGLRPCPEPLFNHPVGERQYLDGNFEPERLSGLEVDHKLELGRLDDRQISGLFAWASAPGADIDMPMNCDL
jgi:hypothetical protein